MPRAWPRVTTTPTLSRCTCCRRSSPTPRAVPVACCRAPAWRSTACCRRSTAPSRACRRSRDRRAISRSAVTCKPSLPGPRRKPPSEATPTFPANCSCSPWPTTRARRGARSPKPACSARRSRLPLTPCAAARRSPTRKANPIVKRSPNTPWISPSGPDRASSILSSVATTRFAVLSRSCSVARRTTLS